MKGHTSYGAVILFAFVFLFGCANYGTVKPTSTQEVTVESLMKNWMNYTVYWTGLNEGEPTAIMFDPNGDGKTLMGAANRWYKVESRESLSNMVDWLKFNRLYYPYVWKVVGHGGQLYGYVYTGYTQFVMKAVNDNTMMVYRMPTTLRGEDRRLFEKH